MLHTKENLLWVLAGLVLGASSAPATTQQFAVQHALHGVPAGWVQKAKADATEQIHLKVAMKANNWEAFEKHAINIATPGHPLYGKHLTYQQVRDWTKPSAEATNAVTQWLRQAEVSDFMQDGEWIHLNASVASAEKLLNTDFHQYQHVSTGQTNVRTLAYSLPVDIRAYIDMVQPTTRFLSHNEAIPKISDLEINTDAHIRVQTDNEARKLSSDCVDKLNKKDPFGGGAVVTPACLRELYNIGDFKPNGKNGNKLGIAGFLEQYAKYKDLTQFVTNYFPAGKGANFTWVGVNGGLNDQSFSSGNDSVEANLDVQYAIAFGHPVDVTYYVTGGRPTNPPPDWDLDQPKTDDPGKITNEPYLEWVTYLLQLKDDELPQVITHSYGEDEQTVPDDYSKKVCQAYAQLGARGTSIIFSSGDTGVGSSCQTNDGKNTTRFMPIFPATCPWVTSVGGTTKVQPEQAIGFSSGGFSERFPRPEWQVDALTTYLQGLGKQWDGLYNPQGRGFPDVAAQAQGYRVVDKGTTKPVGGTSAAAPVFAGIVSLLNSARLDAKQPPLGFLNPWLYTSGKAGFTDIVNGGSEGCTGTSYYTRVPASKVPGATWKAVPGWDPVTGFGTPDFQKLLKLSASATGFKPPA